MRNLRGFPAARIVVGLFCCVVGLAACGDGETFGPRTDTPPVTTPNETTPNETTSRPFEVKYADVAAIGLRDAGLPADTAASQLSVASGEANGLTVRDGEIRFITPSDPGVDAKVVLRVASASSVVNVPVTVASARPVDPFAHIEPDENGQLDPVALQSGLVVTGLGPNNAVTGQPLTFSVEGAPPLDPVGSSATIYVPSEKRVIDITKQWVLDPATNKLIVPAQAMAEVLAEVPSGEVEFDIGLSSVDANFGVAWTFPAYKPTAVLKGQVVGFDGSPQASAAGKQVAIWGIDNRTRVVAQVDGSGAFTAGAVGAGTYRMTILDATAPNFWIGTTAVFPDSTQVMATLLYAPASGQGGTPSPEARARPNAAGDRSSSIRFEAATIQDGSGPPPRPEASRPSVRRLDAAPAECESAGEAPGEANYVVVAGEQNKSASCRVRHAVPQGTREVGVTISVSTHEHPYYTRSRSQYNDTWSYSLGGLAGGGAATASVNDSHYTRATLTRTHCMKVGEHTAGSIVIEANLEATNVADSFLPTLVKMDVKLTCSSELKVVSAKFASPNGQGHGVIKASKGNLPGNYLSIPIVSAVDNWGIPLDVEFEPKRAQITGVRMGIVMEGEPVMSDSELSGAITSRSEGRLQFSDVAVPRIPVATFPGKVNVVVELTGTVDGHDAVSEPADGTVSFDGSKAFIPLFLAGDELGAARRYGQASGSVEPGRDSWAKFETIDWLKSNAYRFNDVSALHVAQTASGRSVLDHVGHSDGTQVDLRYADGVGGYGDKLGGMDNGSHIKAMLNAASTAATTGGNGTALAQAVTWIQANRKLLEKEAAIARAMYCGNAWMKLALLEGRFPNGTPVPGLGAWTTVPGHLTFLDGHHHHWHMSLKP